MKKSKIDYLCRECGFSSIQWSGKCPACGSWDALDRVNIMEKQKTSLQRQPPSKAEGLSVKNERIKTNFSNFNNVLGGGIVSGSSILLSGEPGIGKSTLLLQILPELAKSNSVIYFSGEEIEEQLVDRARRVEINLNNIYFKYTPYLENIAEDVETLNPGALIVDSIQTIQSTAIPSSAGTISQVRECAQNLIKIAKERNVPLIIIGHITKEGVIAGPKTLEHMVDVVLYLEGDSQSSLKMLRTTKNRFGSSSEIAFLQMNEKGFKEVSDNELEAGLGEFSHLPGTSMTMILEGSRLYLAEIQALISPTFSPYPRRVFSGVDFNRALQLLAVVDRRCGLNLARSDVYISTTGNLNIKDRSADLAIIAALLSSYYESTPDKMRFYLGEVGLQGEVRKVPQLERRLKELLKRGYKEVIIPEEPNLEFKNSGLQVKIIKEIRGLKKVFTS
ncbi:MAG: DNA repair protein RadA [candidate division WS2 bacterium]|uniref:DNA repair protein RadA n=1 Tax=Psychracetigena formicireducens TaxID=2986056 RepID=A0A9E2F0Y3_PSYF1|nr:DNA repair protein RadA [Candidatus Psychracetigena formicireducens]MBT9144884.1 DNA repair protein RadA [Candidatus Psychracetigena formicireducens]MBT9149866.1 DNA repair protein RadA [Candidatus Psychracetigena formicireducens]